MNTIELPGMTTTPFLSYLAALGLLKVASEQLDSTIQARWEGQHFELVSEDLNESDIVNFLLDDYRPSPILSPWNASGGFQDGRDRPTEQIVRRFEESTSPRLHAYRQTITAARTIWIEAHARELIVGGKVIPKKKELFLAMCRGQFPDEALPWIDTAMVLTDGGIAYPLVVGGSGGNSGRFELSNNFMQALELVMMIDSCNGDANVDSRAWLADCLRGGSSADLHQSKASLFDPGGAGGPNSSFHGEAEELLNPWKFVLAMEGSLSFASSAARRMSSGNSSGPSTVAVPFTVKPTAAGYGSSSEDEEVKGEVWAPLWRKSMTGAAVMSMMGEGRSQWGNTQASDGLDFIRAIGSLGVDRHIDAFVRYSIAVRYGQNALAVPVSIIEVNVREGIDLLLSVDQFLRGFGGSRLPMAVASAKREVERAEFAFAQQGGGLRLAKVLTKLSELEQALGRASGFRKDNGWIRPVANLVAIDWHRAMSDLHHRPEYRLAMSLALARDKKPKAGSNPLAGPSLALLVRPVERENGRIIWSAKGPLVAGLGESPIDELLARCLRERAVRALGRPLPTENLEAAPGVAVGFDLGSRPPLSDVEMFLTAGGSSSRRDQFDLSLFGDLLAGLVVLDPKTADEIKFEDFTDEGLTLPPDPIWALTASLVCGAALHRDPERSKIPTPTAKVRQGLISAIANGNTKRAAEMAIHHLRVDGFSPNVRAERIRSGPTNRVAAALLVPLSMKSAATLRKRVCSDPPKEPSTDITNDDETSTNTTNEEQDL